MTDPRTPIERARSAFQTGFGGTPAFDCSAPGRVNLIGEHTDYNDGFVFPAAIDFHITMAVREAPGSALDVIASDEGNQRVQIDLSALQKSDTQAPWSNYLRGVISELQKAGHTLKGGQIAISGNIPLGAGLSSSAALEICSLVALSELAGIELQAADAAALGQAAENNFVGMRCGIMDQLVSAAGVRGHALLLDCRSLQTRTIPIPDDLRIVVFNSNVRHTLVDGQYNQRRAQCEAAAAHFGVTALRDLNVADLNRDRHKLDDVVFRRARHVVTENERTLAMAKAIAEQQIEVVSRLMSESHISMRDDFEITIDEIDTLVDIVNEVAGSQAGVRMTGGGFGGCVVVLAPLELVEDIVATVEQAYPARTGRTATSYLFQAANGAFVSSEN